MTSGGKREGSGRPSKAIVRRAMVNLDAAHNALLMALEEEHRMSASEVLKWCLRVASGAKRTKTKAEKG